MDAVVLFRSKGLSCVSSLICDEASEFQDEIRDEFQEKRSLKSLSGLKARRTKHRQKMMDRARSFTERLKHNFPEGFDSVGMKAAYRDIQMQSVLSASEDNILKVWNPETGEV